MYYRISLLFYFFIFPLMLFGSPTVTNNDSSEVTYTLFLIGDTGLPKLDGEDEILNMLQEKLMQSGENSGVIFLGDNIYPSGLPPVRDRRRPQAEKYILEQLNVLKDYEGDIFFVAGNHDWQKGRRQGLSYLLRQEAFINDFFDGEQVFYPGGGCPGPVEIELNEQVTLVLLDTQWMLHAYTKPGERSHCEYGNIEDVMDALEDILAKNNHKQLIVAAHHPLFTYGSHGGVATLKQHIFPLTEAVKNLYLPLPVLGSVYPGYRKYIGHVQDINHPLYNSVRTSMSEIFSKFPGMVYAAGHDHNLQHIIRDSIHYVISGSGSKTDLVKKGPGSEFALSKNGFGELKYFDNGNIQFRFWIPGEDSAVYQSEWMVKPTLLQDSIQVYEQDIDYSDSTVLAMGSSRYMATGFTKQLLGENYRKEWQTPLEVPIFDFTGYNIIKMGGGQSTKSLRLEDEDGRQYVLRTVDKNPEKALPQELRGTIVADIFQDQVSANHPYGSLIIPHLSNSAGIYHTNPKLMLIPDDPRLGRYREEFKNTLVLFEERPEDEWKGHESFGSPDDIDSYSTVINNVIESNDVEVDQQFVIKNRLFDMIVGDWDRHDDQWRWAQFDEDDDRRIYRPIPRDRDQVFFRSDGAMTKLFSKLMPKFEGFNPEIKNVKGFNYNARYFDRFFITEPSARDWLKAAEDLQSALTDQAIEDAVKTWPKEIFLLNGQDIINTLKSRRDRIHEYAMDYYLVLAENVNVLGSDESERFIIERLNDRETRVAVYKLDDNKEIVRKLYDRLFITGQTKEVRLYGFDGYDEFLLEGEVKKGITIRIIGGEGPDRIIDESKVSGWGKKTIVYDTKEEENVVALSSSGKDKRSNRFNVNEYNREEYKNNQFIPLLLTDYNSEDKIFIGAGAYWVTHGFRKYPFSSKNILSAQFAPVTTAFDIDYRGEFTDVFGRTNLMMNADLRLPSYTNYFGLGNESENLSSKDSEETDRSFYQIRIKNVRSNIFLKRNIGEFAQFLIGPSYEYFKIESQATRERFINNLSENDEEWEIMDNDLHYGGLGARFTVDTRNDPNFTTTGIFYYLTSDYISALNDHRNSFTKITSGLSMYLTFGVPFSYTIINHTGGGTILGDFDFFHGLTLGENANLRGYRKNRFTGRANFYNNTEIRVTLFNLKRFILPGPVGVLGFYDVGKVYLKDVSSRVWHKGYGAGLWYAPLNKVVGSLSAGFSREESFQFNIDLSYSF